MAETAVGTDEYVNKLHHRSASVDGVNIFYREGGPTDGPALLLLPGFPAASYQYVPLMRRLAGHIHVISPDYPGFGYSDAPAASSAGGSFVYSFDHIAGIIDKFLAALGQRRFFVYMFDFGAPVGFRIACKHPQWIRGIIAQNANAYEEGLGPNMQSLRAFWKDRAAHEEQVKEALSFAATRSAHLQGVRNPELVDPDMWTLDQHWLDQPGRTPIMLDLFHDYQNNVAAYPAWQKYLRTHRPPMLLPWGKNDAYFPGAGARAYLKDVPDAELHLLDTGHFALDDHLDEIAALITDFIARHAH
ncbi:MAG TPA: alpha/beta hydrolase [Salinisphaeraceae bacterium]|nr:alpha/beta hydrolase [Salinisphaeraceae bacterium]